MIERAIARGEIPRDSDVDVLMDMLYGPAYHRLFQRHLPLTEDFVLRVVAVIVAGAKAGGAVPLTIQRDRARPEVISHVRIVQALVDRRKVGQSL